MTAEERAALVERVADTISMVFEGQGITETAEGVIGLIRAEVLEEAAKECAYHWTPKECAAAIRALKEKP